MTPPQRQGFRWVQNLWCNSVLKLYGWNTMVMFEWQFDIAVCEVESLDRWYTVFAIIVEMVLIGRSPTWPPVEDMSVNGGRWGARRLAARVKKKVAWALSSLVCDSSEADGSGECGVTDGESWAIVLYLYIIEGEGLTLDLSSYPIKIVYFTSSHF